LRNFNYLKSCILKASINFFVPIGLSLFISPAIARPKVVVSIQPIYSLTAGVMKDVGKPILLIKGTQSPHLFALRPSEAKFLNSADLIVWVDANLERSLEKPITVRGNKAKQLRLINLKGLHLYPFRKDHICTSHTHRHTTSYDPHIWMDIFNAKIIVTAIADKLSTIDPQNAKTYQTNQQALIKKLDRLDQKIRLTLLPFKQKAFMVFHDGYQYFEKSYNLKGLGAITLDPELQTSIKHLNYIQKIIIQQDVKCLFSEAQFNSRLVERLSKIMNLKLGVLDPYGAHIRDIPEELYFILMQNLASDFAKGLK
jgi:zinc transport system substrate-binding protein